MWLKCGEKRCIKFKPTNDKVLPFIFGTSSNNKKDLLRNFKSILLSKTFFGSVHEIKY